MSDKEETAAFLIKRGADVHALSNNGKTALHVAVGARSKSCAKLLLDKGADTRAKNNSGQSILHIAVHAGDAEMVEVLLSNGAGVDAYDNFKDTPLHAAARLGDAPCTQAIIEYVMSTGGSDAAAALVDAKNNFGKTAVDLASQKGHGDVSMLLIKARNRLQLHDMDPLHPHLQEQMLSTSIPGSIANSRYVSPVLSSRAGRSPSPMALSRGPSPHRANSTRSSASPLVDGMARTVANATPSLPNTPVAAPPVPASFAASADMAARLMRTSAGSSVILESKVQSLRPSTPEAAGPLLGARPHGTSLAVPVSSRPSSLSEVSLNGPQREETPVSVPVGVPIITRRRTTMMGASLDRLTMPSPTVIYASTHTSDQQEVEQLRSSVEDLRSRIRDVQILKDQTVSQLQSENDALKRKLDEAKVSKDEATTTARAGEAALVSSHARDKRELESQIAELQAQNQALRVAQAVNKDAGQGGGGGGGGGGTQQPETTAKQVFLWSIEDKIPVPIIDAATELREVLLAYEKREKMPLSMHTRAAREITSQVFDDLMQTGAPFDNDMWTNEMDLELTAALETSPTFDATSCISRSFLDTVSRTRTEKPSETYPILSTHPDLFIDGALALRFVFLVAFVRAVLEALTQYIDLDATISLSNTDVEGPSLGNLVLSLRTKFPFKRRFLLMPFLLRPGPGAHSFRPHEISLDRIKAAASSRRGDWTGCIFGQLFAQVGRLPYLNAGKGERAWRVTFVGEAGGDGGGLYNESVTLACQELMTDAIPLFIKTPNARNELGYGRDLFIPRRSATSPINRRMFMFVGRLMGIALRSGLTLPLRLAPLFWKLLVKDPVSSDDLRSVDVISARMIRLLKTSSLHEESMYGASEDSEQETFTTLASDGSVIELKEGGVGLVVTHAQRKEYALLADNARLREFEVQVDWIRDGLRRIIPAEPLYLLSAAELETLVCGSPEINLNALKRHVKYISANADPPAIKFLWQALESFTAEERELFVKFAWGRARLPVSDDQWGVPMTISLLDEKNILPSAATCAFTLRWPQYETYEKARDRLLYAITNTAEMDLY